MTALKTATAALVLAAALALLAAPGEGPADPAPPDEEVDITVGSFAGSNGFTDDAQFARDRAEFEDTQTVEKGLGPVFNADSCAACHHNPVTGGGSVVTELRAGKNVDGQFVEHPGGSLIHSRALDPLIQERVFAGFPVRGTRISPSVLGLGFVECFADDDITAYIDTQPPHMKGQPNTVGLLEAPDKSRLGRFGWKNQHASLLSFAADAYLNEMGITSPLLPVENTSNGRDVGAFDKAKDPEDTGGEGGFGNDVESFAAFMRATKAPPRDFIVAALPDASAGLVLFRELGCNVCHREEFVTLPEGAPINGGTFKVPPALAKKIIRPYSDFLLHDIGTGDGIVQGGPAVRNALRGMTRLSPPSTANKFRTAPLWGLRTKSRLMHDGLTYTRHEAILRHDSNGGEAIGTVAKYKILSPKQQRQLHVFLRSL